MKIDELKIPGNGYNLAATLVIPDGKRKNLPSVVFYHGMVSRGVEKYRRRAETLAREGIMSLLFGFRACWDSEGELGKITIGDWFNDAILAFDFLSKYSLVDPNRIGINGKSFGGYIGALVSEIRNVKSMVLQAPAVYEDREFNKIYKFDSEKTERNDYRHSERALDNKAIRAIEKYKNPLLIIGGELDDVCPRPTIEDYFEHAGSLKKELVWIKEADHPLTKPEWDEEYTKLMVTWFSKTL